MFTATQKWFLLNPLNTMQGTPEYDEYKWFVPITYTTQDENISNFEKRPKWLKPTDKEINIDTTKHVFGANYEDVDP